MEEVTAGNEADKVVKINGQKGTLSYRTTDSIRQPANIELDGDFLTWKTEYDQQANSSSFVYRPSAGCLENFLTLASATSEEVLAFARQHGVLGVNPIVQEIGAVRPGDLLWWAGSSTIYMERVETYRNIASSAKMLVEMAAALREGEPIDPDLFHQLFPDKQGSPQVHYYAMVSMEARRWSNAATINLGLVTQLPGSHPSMTGEHYFGLDFGEWENGKDWDAQFSCDDIDLTWSLESAENARIRPFDYPMHYQRPSPLFNLLTFQLLGAVVLPADNYFCAVCGKMFKWEDVEGRRRPRQNAPAYCGEGCRREAELRQDRERKRKK